MSRPRDQVHDGPREATVHDDLVAVDVGRTVAGKEGHGISDVLRHANAAHWRHRGTAFGYTGCIIKSLAHRRDHHAGADHIAADAVRPPFAGELARQHDDAGLADAVGAALALRIAGCDGGDVNEAAALLLAHLRPEGLRAEETAGEVDR